MPRRRRICHPNLTYHVFSRCIERRELLNNNFKRILIKTIQAAQMKYDFELIHFAVLNNQFHSIIKTPETDPSISRIMQYIKSRFAEQYNRQKKRSGPFWNERFKDQIIEHQSNPSQYQLWLMWHIGYNPVRNGYVKIPEDYRYSGLIQYLREKTELPVTIALHNYFIDLGSSFIERMEKFRLFERAFFLHEQIRIDTS